ncbi:MAG: membrane protein insertion efficiency factor YidD [Verrucomicrobia bacterium]|nr:membrane protein insertion efficiency factor YidD [Verrucomicrobiota bacterium]
MKYFFILLIRLYQLMISPLLGTSCRFFPSCSHYAKEAFEKKGVFRGLYLSVKRLVKCGPWHPGGYDPL